MEEVLPKRLIKRPLNLSVQRQVSSGGGLYTMVENTTATLGVRRSLGGRWEADLHGGATRLETSITQLAGGKMDSLLGGFRLSRPLSNGSTFYISYDICTS